MSIDEYEHRITVEAIRMSEERGWPIEMCRITAEFMAAMLYGRPNKPRPKGFVGGKDNS